MVLLFVFVLKIKIKLTFTLFFYMIFMFSLSLPWDTFVNFQQMCSLRKTPHVTLSPACLILYKKIIIELGTFDSGQVALHNISKTTLVVGVLHGR